MSEQASPKCDSVRNAQTRLISISARKFGSENCPTCGSSPMRAPSGYYELGDDGVLRKTGDYRP